MTPQEFKKRYLEGIREGFQEAPEEIRAGLEQRFSEFVTFPRELLEAASLSPADRDFLSEAGLPKAAAPALNFRNLYDVRPDLESHPFFKDYFAIGSARDGRLIVIERESGEIVCFDLSGETVEPTFVNNSLEQFAECLCLFQEYRDRNELDICLEAMSGVDAKLIEYHSFWQEETENFFDNIVDILNEAAAKSGK